jgi:hypothetical protein
MRPQRARCARSRAVTMKPRTPGCLSQLGTTPIIQAERLTTSARGTMRSDGRAEGSSGRHAQAAIREDVAVYDATTAAVMPRPGLEGKEGGDQVDQRTDENHVPPQQLCKRNLTLPSETEVRDWRHGRAESSRQWGTGQIHYTESPWTTTLQKRRDWRRR